jgi:hypothetical protein
LVDRVQAIEERDIPKGDIQVLLNALRNQFGRRNFRYPSGLFEPLGKPRLDLHPVGLHALSQQFAMMAT